MTETYDEDIAQLREITETFEDGIETARVGSVGYEEDDGSIVHLFTDEDPDLRDVVAETYLGNLGNRGGSKRYTITPQDDGYRLEAVEDGFTVTEEKYGLSLRFDESDAGWALEEAAKLSLELER